MSDLSQRFQFNQSSTSSCTLSFKGLSPYSIPNDNFELIISNLAMSSGGYIQIVWEIDSSISTIIRTISSFSNDLKIIRENGVTQIWWGTTKRFEINDTYQFKIDMSSNNQVTTFTQLTLRRL